MDLKERIQELCKRDGISMNQLEHKMEFGKGYISKLGKSTPNTAKMKKIADFFEVTIDYLMTGKEDSQTTQSNPAENEREIGRDLDRVMAEMKRKAEGPLYYNGKLIDDESLDLLVKALELGMSRLKNKKN